MDALQKAVRMILDSDVQELEYAKVTIEQAKVYAAIAQAEAMQLLAKRLEQWMDSQGVGFEMIEAAERGLRYEKENQRLARRIAELEGEPVESEYRENTP
jgi:beta-galactosidase beta subunit